ncbi:MAG: T9SS type A sorting domain-containing protein [Ignavibacteria bacterium]|nr:T9SS type A sorting domain-containing protein [Ignavibacteria bacterium]
MIRKLSMFFFLVLFTQVFLVAQQKMILRPDNTLEKITKSFDGREVMKAQPSKHAVQSKAIKSHTLSKSVNGIIDTLFMDVDWDSNFGAFGQDWVMQWFQAPTDLIIKQVGFSTYDQSSPNVEIKIVRVKWTPAELLAAGEKNWGYYQATGNGFNDITAFPTNPDATGGWVAVQAGAASPFDVTDIWSDAGTGNPMVGVKQTDPGSYQWFPTNLIAEPNIAKGEVFGIALKNTNTNLTSSAAADRYGIWGGSLPNANAWKYYANGRSVLGTAGDKGWWSRKFAWDFAVEVDLVGDVPPTFDSFEKLTTTVNQGVRTVHAKITDKNPGGAAGVASAVLHYSLDSGKTFTDVTMAGSEPNYTADIPGQSPGQYVVYNATATDNNGNFTDSKTFAYSIFLPTAGIKTLVVFNGSLGYSEGDYPQDYYFGIDSMKTYDTYQFPHDVWGYGPLEKGLVDNYDNIFEICVAGPADYNETVIKEWLAGKSTRNYFLAGQEYLGAKNAYTNVTYKAGDFEYDILGLAGSWNDISYAGDTGQKLPSRLFAKTGTDLGGDLLTKFTTLGTDSLNYDPTYELGSSIQDNWIDGFDVQTGQAVDVEVESRGIDNVAHVANYPCVTHRTLTAGNKIVFMSLDPLSVNSRPVYYWFGFSKVAPQVKALEWFGANVSTSPTIEFRANMKIQMEAGKFAATDPINVKGSFDGWAAGVAMTDADSDSIYTATVTTGINVGDVVNFKYMFTHGTTDTWETDPNRTLTVASGANVFEDYFDRLGPKVRKQIALTFTVNMELERLSGLFNPATDTVSVRGTINGWGQTIMTASGINADLYEVTMPFLAGVGDNIEFKFFYTPGTWESIANRPYVFTQADFDGSAAVIEGSFNDGDINTVLNQPANIKFTVNTNGRTIIDAPAGTEFSTVHIAGGNSPLQWPTGGWPDSDIDKVIQLFDDGTHGDANAGDKIFTTVITFPAYSTLYVTYKYGANWGLPTKGLVNDNENGVGADHHLQMGKLTANATVVDTFGVAKVVDVTKVEKLGNTIPTVYMMEQNYPNPFNPETNIRFSIPQESFVTVKVFNTLGEEVMTLVNEEKTAGTYNVSFNAKSLTSGIYFYTIKANDFTSTKKMILMK